MPIDCLRRPLVLFIACMAATALAAKKPSVPDGELKVGEYACYGSGGRVLIGLGFKVLPGGRYTDLDGKNAGRFSIKDRDVQFSGGHLEKTPGRDLKNGRFRVGRMAECEPF